MYEEQATYSKKFRKEKNDVAEECEVESRSASVVRSAKANQGDVERQG